MNDLSECIQQDHDGDQQEKLDIHGGFVDKHKDQSGENDWAYTAPSSDFRDFREANIQFDTNGKAALAGHNYVIWLVDGANRQVSPQVGHAGDSDFQWVHVVFTLK